MLPVQAESQRLTSSPISKVFKSIPLLKELILRAVWLPLNASVKMPFCFSLHYSFRSWQHPVHIFLSPYLFRKHFFFENQISTLTSILKIRTQTHTMKYVITLVLGRTYTVSLQLNSINFCLYQLCSGQGFKGIHKEKGCHDPDSKR